MLRVMVNSEFMVPCVKEENRRRGIYSTSFYRCNRAGKS